MKKFVINLTGLFALALLASQTAPAQGTIYASNLGNVSAGSISIGNNSWIAQEFFWLGAIVNGVQTTPDFTLTSVQLLMGAASGTPSGFTVSIYSSLGNTLVGSSLGTLDGSANPSSGGIFTYTTSGIRLSPATGYFVVVTAATPINQGAYNWNYSTFLSQNFDNNLRIDDDYSNSSDGFFWTRHSRQNIFQMAVYGTPVPEPSAISLIFLGVGVLFYVRKRTFSH